MNKFYLNKVYNLKNEQLNKIYNKINKKEKN